MCLCFSDLSRSVFQLARSCSFSSLYFSLWRCVFLLFFQGSQRWETLKWMRIQLKQLRQMGLFIYLLCFFFFRLEQWPTFPQSRDLSLAPRVRIRSQKVQVMKVSDFRVNLRVKLTRLYQSEVAIVSKWSPLMQFKSISINSSINAWSQCCT